MIYPPTEIFPYESKFLDVGPHKQAYLDEGDADQTLLCVHGNPTWSFYWRGVVQRFSKSHRVVTVDHIGCGRSDKPSASQFAYTMESHRDNVVRLIDELDLRNITLIAHDWGGAIGLASVLKRLDRVNGIVLLNTAAFPPPYIPMRISACRWPIIGKPMVQGLNAFARAAVPMAMSRNKMKAEVAKGLLAPYDSWKNRVAINGFVRDIPMKQTHPTYRVLEQLESDLPKLSELPKLLVWGMQDWCFRPECLRRFQAAWPEATSVEIQDAGHYVIEDAPEETLDAIAQFLDRPAS